jgi:hypothetical protein
VYILNIPLILWFLYASLLALVISTLVAGYLRGGYAVLWSIFFCITSFVSWVPNGYSGHFFGVNKMLIFIAILFIVVISCACVGYTFSSDKVEDPDCKVEQ